jgi:outer membrane protein
MKKVLYSFIIISFTVVRIQAQQADNRELTLKEAIEHTIKNYPLIKQAEQNLDVINAKIKQQQSFDYPNVNAEASYTRIGPLPVFAFPGFGVIELAPANNYDAHISAFYNLYDFGKNNSQLDVIESYKKSVGDNIAFVKSTLAYAVVQGYYTILFLEKSIDINDTDVATLNEHINITNKKIESGTATDYDLLSTKVRLTDYQSNKVTLKNQLNDQKIVLKQLTGLNDNEINIKGDFKLLTSYTNVDSLIQVAFNQRPEIKLAVDEENTAHLSKTLASNGNLPDLSVGFIYGLKNGFEPNLDAIRGNWAATVNMSVPIFNGFRTRGKEEEAEANLKISETNTLHTKIKITAEVQKAVENLNSNLDQVKTAELKISLAEEALQKARAQYSSGVGTNLDLLDAETRLADARFLYLQTIYNNIIDTYQLKKAVGDIIW